MTRLYRVWRTDRRYKLVAAPDPAAALKRVSHAVKATPVKQKEARP